LSSERGSIRILYLEDNPLDADLVQSILGSSKFDCLVVRANDRGSFERALSAGGYDLILSDYALPGFDGAGALALAQRVCPDVPFIFVSGSIGEERALETLRSGATDYLLKDRLSRLPSAVSRALEEAADRRRRREAEQQLEAERRRLKIVLETVEAGIIACDAQGQPTLFNRTARDLYGLPADGAPPAEPAAGPFYQPDGKTPLPPEQVPLSRALRGETVRNVELVIAPDGRAHTVLASGQPIVDAEGHNLGAVVLLQDISERKRSEEELRRQREVLHQSEKLASMGTLLASVAHELNNPLSIVVGQAGLLSRVAGPGPLAQRAEKIERAAERCARIVANFLALARQRPPERRRVQLNAVVQEAVELLTYAIRTDSIELCLQLARDLPPLFADAHQLHQVIVNLVTNAQHALRGATPPRCITLATSFRSGRLVLEVADTGAGIPLELQPRVFEPFFTTKAPGEGTGLGLPLCKGIIEEHGGSIELQSGVGCGALFRIVLPVQQAETAPRTAPPAVYAQRAEARSILIVDDEADVAELLAELLRECGHDVDIAKGGLAGFERLAHHGGYDLIITDMKMPDLDGPGLYQQALRLNPELGSRFLFITGDGFSGQTQRFLAEAGAPSLNKPFESQHALSVIDAALARKRRVAL
jgi:PAS domain S-box-containing protein